MTLNRIRVKNEHILSIYLSHIDYISLTYTHSPTDLSFFPFLSLLSSQWALASPNGILILSLKLYYHTAALPG
jgi:hypothetical protein